jgi:hypothetical protein
VAQHTLVGEDRFPDMCGEHLHVFRAVHVRRIISAIIVGVIAGAVSRTSTTSWGAIAIRAGSIDEIVDRVYIHRGDEAEATSDEPKKHHRNAPKGP